MWKFIKRIVFLVIVLSLLGLLAGRFFNPPITYTQIGGVVKYGKLQRDYIPLQDMGVQIQKAVIAAEDQKFFQHNGFDYEAIQKALKHNEQGKKLRGGSTISQQTAKNVFLWQSRSWIRKGFEAFFTFAMEALWPKEVILERYLNSIEMGQGVFGIEAASQYYFGKNAKSLTKSQAAWIAAILPSPQKYDPNNPSSYLRKRHSWILKQMTHVRLP